MKRISLLPVFVVFSAQLANAQPVTTLDAREKSCAATATPLLILGTYHMANPGQDAVNMTADDPRSPRRQKELSALLDRLEWFAPTKVAVEGVYGRTPWIARYRDYVKGSYTLGTNEIEQIGFQLARRAKLPNISGVDYPMWMDGRVPDEIDYDWSPPATKTTVAPATEKAPPSAEEQRLAKSTVTEFLYYLNNADRAKEDHAKYMDFLRPSTSSNAPFANTDALTNWYKRNFRIFTNLYRVSDPGKDRVLLLIGAGHLSILQQLAIDSPDFCLVDTESFLK